MRVLCALTLIAAVGAAGSALAQPNSPLPAQAQPPGSPKAEPAKSEAESADQALAMTIRAQKEQDERIARIACAAGDKDKCAQLEKAATAPKTPSP
jgi:hypothetical protein